MIELHPYQYAYFNNLVGGVRAADSRYMLDYWGLSFKQATDELLAVLEERGIETPEGRRWVRRGLRPDSAGQCGIRSGLPADRQSKGRRFRADARRILLRRTRRTRTRRRSSAKGVVFARVYDIRGRNVKDLNTIPPVINNSN